MSMGDHVSLSATVVSDEIKKGVIWGGVVVPYPDLITLWDIPDEDRSDRHTTYVINPDEREMDDAVQTWWVSFSRRVEEFTAEYGWPEENPDFWKTISPNAYLQDLSSPILIQHGSAHSTFPFAWPKGLSKIWRKQVCRTNSSLTRTMTIISYTITGKPCRRQSFSSINI